MIVIPNEGKILAVERWLAPDPTTGETWVVGLFQNNYTPVDATVAGDFVPASFTGYAPVNITEGNWGAGAITSNVAYSTSSVSPLYTCTAGASQTIYGWYAVGLSTGKCLAAERFAASITIVPGASIELDPFKIGFQTLH